MFLTFVEKGTNNVVAKNVFKAITVYTYCTQYWQNAVDTKYNSDCYNFFLIFNTLWIV